MNADKTEQLHYTTSLNCTTDPYEAYLQMKAVYEQYSGHRFDSPKPKKGRAHVKTIHYIMSFADSENVTPELAFKIAKNLVDKALEVNKKETNNTVVSGLIVTGDWFVDSQEKMRSILEKFPDAKAVDMESCAIAHTCHLYQTPFISFRIISDIPLKDNKAAQYFDFWARMAEGSFNVTKRFLELL